MGQGQGTASAPWMPTASPPFAGNSSRDFRRRAYHHVRKSVTGLGAQGRYNKQEPGIYKQLVEPIRCRFRLEPDIVTDSLQQYLQGSTHHRVSPDDDDLDSCGSHADLWVTKALRASSMPIYALCFSAPPKYGAEAGLQPYASRPISHGAGGLSSEDRSY